MTCKSLLLVGLLAWVSAAAQAAGPADAAKAPALPTIQALQLEPASLNLHDGRDARKVLVWGIAADGQKFDLTAQAQWAPGAANVAVDADGFIYPNADGPCVVKVSAAGREAQLLVTVAGAAVPPIGFVRDIMPIMGKVGCNAGTCHGAAKGKNGFRMSLRGYDPLFDYRALVNDISGRRFNRVRPEESLLLLKPMGEVPHEGLQVIKPESRYHDLILQWIKEGVAFDAPEARARSIDVLPTEVNLDVAGRSQQVVVLATYSDGSVRDVTREAVITSSNIEVAAVDRNTITGLRRGEASVLVRYEGSYATSLITVMGDRSGYQWVQRPVYNSIDEHVDAKLKKVKAVASDLCSDADFVRRVYLDLTGVPPTPEAARAFVEDATPSRDKRAKLIDALIGSEDYVEFWANKWADLLQCNQDALGDKGVWTFRSWIRRAIASNMPYDQFVRTLIDAKGSAFSNPEVNYLRSLRNTGKMTEDISQTFLGVRFNCNKCHDHPFERWTQDQYYQFGAYFARVAFKKGRVEGDEVVYDNFNGGEVTHPKTNMAVPPEAPFGKASVSAEKTRRDAVSDWLTAKDNPFFAKSFVNRMWSYVFGRGIIDPVDDIRAGNPPSNPALLDALTKEFIDSGFDVRRLVRTMCNSRTYQLAVATDKWNEDDKINFSHALPRRLSAEQLLDAIAIATDTKPNVPGLPAGYRAVCFPSGEIKGNDFLKLFGRPPRESACECERTSNVSLAHALSLVNGDVINSAVAAGNNRIARLVRDEKDNRKVIVGIYYACLSRPPSDAEVAAIDLGSDDAQRLAVAQDLAWALMNSGAFLFNR